MEALVGASIWNQGLTKVHHGDGIPKVFTGELGVAEVFGDNREVGLSILLQIDSAC
jgi:hypothetical protein